MMQMSANFITKLNLKNRFHKFIEKWLFGYGIDYLNPIKLGFFIVLAFSVPYCLQEAGGFEKLRFLCIDQFMDAFFEALRLSAFSFLSSPQGNGLYSWCGIIEKILGVIISSAFTVTLAKKILR